MKLTLSNPRQILTMTLVWATALFAVEYIKHPRQRLFLEFAAGLARTNAMLVALQSAPSNVRRIRFELAPNR